MSSPEWRDGHETTERGRDPCPHDAIGVGLGVRVDGNERGDRRVKVNEINVETFKGVVQLSGFVRSQADINQAVKVARGVAGVKSVKNDMRIK
jgi:hypothetical protein